MEYRGHDRGWVVAIRHAASAAGQRSLVGLVLLAGAVNAGCGDSSTGPDQGPEVLSVSPEAGALAAPVVGSVVVSFSGLLDSVSLLAAIVLDDDGREYRGLVSPRGASTIEFVPSDPLDFGTTYRATIRSTLRDRDGNHLAADYAWTFRTQGSPPPAMNPDSMQSYIRVLADDSMRGRAAGTDDEQRAAQYLASRFSDWGLSPLLTNLVQPFRAPSRTGQMLDSRNVLGVVPGTGSLAGEWVVVGAHFDAMGMISDGSGGWLVRNGADDNASGTAMMLELARQYSRFVALGGTAGISRRAVLFAGFGSEEVGLVGSCEFVSSAAIPSAQMAAMVNFDMVGRLRANTIAAQNGGSAGAWDDMLSNTNIADLFMDLGPACSYNCSDYACFASRGVPYVWFFTKTHPDYHQPQDDEALINYDGMVDIGNVAFRVLTRLVVSPDRIAAGALPAATWTSTGM